ncbi:MAG: competence/damage-inducible protein A, partial [Bacteroidetes bacterium]
MTRISFIAIGNELLKGRIVNTNAAEAALLLRQHGYDLNRMLVVGDEASAIAEAVTAELEQQQVVLLSGGLGPTRDDLTKKTLADLFGSRLQLHAPSLQHLKARFAQRKRMLTPRNQQQAYLPHNCEPIPNAKGTAPGMLFKKGKKMLFAMPGVPFELRYMLEHEVIPRIRQVYTPTFIEHRIVRLSHIPESHAADRMAEIEATFDPHLSLAYLPRNDGLWLELSVKVEKGRKDQMLTALNTATARIKAHFTDYVYAEGSDPLEVLVGRFLRQKSLTLAVAESLTGG